MSQLNELLKEAVDLGYDKLFKAADLALDAVLPACEAFDPDDEGAFLLAAVILSAIGADGVLSAKERAFMKELLDLDDETVDSVIDMYDIRLADIVDRFADSMDEDVKAHVASFVIAILACDGNVSREENLFIRKIIN